MNADGDVERAKARLREEFPGWSIIYTDRGRWWATRPTAVDEDPPRAESGTLDADTPDDLRAELRSLTKSRSGAGHTP
ncbi:hypothetical protein [Actinomadura terrae]|uniref:hypothetical protein n=1 Tax=Actinomadura terrae TaxID=604353 RepID=UPI001FA6E5B5|nr:hypothetical protein [Actinomadura terrae]